MSRWRKEASERIPELQRIIASRDVDNPMMLWIELQLKFQALCVQDPPPLDLVRRIWGYAKWCMESGNDDVATAAAYGFCEHLLHSKATLRVLPQIMRRGDYEQLKSLLLYHSSEAEYAEGLKVFGSGKLE
jgi:hypothetical protein